MPRIRTIKHEFWTDDAMVDLPMGVRLFYIGLWNFADDWGVLQDRPRQLKRLVLPDDDIDPHDYVDQLVGTGRLRRAVNPDGKRVLVIENFRKHQRIDHPSQPRFGKPDTFTYDTPSDQGTPEGSETLARNDEDSTTEVEVGSGSGSGSGEPNPPLSPTETSPPTPNRVVEIWNEECGEVLPRVKTLTKNRRKKITTRCREDSDRDETWWREYFTRVRSTPFLTGDNERGWTADIDFVIRSEDVVAKVFEGAYGTRDGPKQPGYVRDINDWLRRTDGAVGDGEDHGDHLRSVGDASGRRSAGALPREA